MSRRFLALATNLVLAAAALTSSSLKSHVDSLTLTSSFNPVQEAYWTGYPHHRRTPFAVSPDGKSAYLAYLDASGTGVNIQGVNPTTFAAVGDVVSVKSGKEAGGLVAHNDGFALLTNEVVSGEANGVPLAVLYRYTNGQQTFKTMLGGPGIDSDNKLASPDINGDLVFSEKAGYYAAYIVVTSYSGSASGHFGDAIRYVNTAGKLEKINGASSSWGCSHNTGIAFEAADAPPFASLCAEDQGAIWLNTQTQGMGNNGVKVSNEHVINGGSNEPMGGMGGSYSALARFVGSDSYIFSWVSRGAINLGANEWMGAGYTKAENRTSNRNVAIALFSDKKTIVGEQATSKVGAADGDSQINWVTQTDNDCSNAHVATFDKSSALVSWEEISNPSCPFDAMGCKGTFAGTSFQMVDGAGKKVGEVVKSTDTYVSGDMVTMSDGRICWPFVSGAWKLDGPTQGSSVSKMSFACMSSGSGSGTDAGTGSGSSSAAVPVVSSAAVPQASTAGSVATTPVVVSQSTVEAVEETPAASVSIPDGAPRPSLVTLSDPVSNNLPAPTGAVPTDAAPTDSVPVETSEPVIESSAIGVQPSSSINIPNVPSPSFVTLTKSVSNNLPAPTSVTPFISTPGAAEPSVVVPPSSQATSEVKAPVTSGSRTRTRKSHGPRPTRRPSQSKPCKAFHTKIKTVYVTAH